MHLSITPAELSFQAEVRRFFAEDYPRDILDKVANGTRLQREDHVRAQQALQSRGWLGVTWPKTHGGPGWTPIERYLFDEELERAGAPKIIPMAVLYIGPILCAFGTPDQQRRWLPDILESRAMWAQGYSEPDAGSDLANLKMKAVRDGDDYILDGHKIWTSSAHWADWIFCLARTSEEVRKQDGLSLICADMTTPGITVHPIISLDGQHELNRVEFVDVRVPASNLIGEEGRGWFYANELLKNERLSYAHIGRKKADLGRFRKLAAETPSGDGCVLDEPAFRARLAACDAAVMVLEAAVLRALASDVSGAEVSALKVRCTEVAQQVTELGVELAGLGSARRIDAQPDNALTTLPDRAAFAAKAMQTYLFERAQTIYGGSTEIQKNIIWRQIGR